MAYSDVANGFRTLDASGKMVQAEQVFDESRQEFQSAINEDFDDRITELEEEGGSGESSCFVEAVGSGDDAASNILGNDWRMPTLEEVKELETYCTWTYTSINNVNGQKVASKQDPSLYIFLPANGYVNNRTYEGTGVYGYYWTSDRHGTDITKAYYLGFGASDSGGFNYQVRYTGRGVRAVSTKKGIDNGVDLGLPSGLIWSKQNLDVDGFAKDETDMGVWLAWGESKMKDNYDWSTYSMGTSSSIQKYNNSDKLTRLTIGVPILTPAKVFYSPLNGEMIRIEYDGKTIIPGSSIVTSKSHGTFSILGDSYSSYVGYMTRDEADIHNWYPTNDPSTQGYNSGNNVTFVEETWWYLFAQESGMKLDINNSYSGSPICYDGYGTGTSDAKEYSFIARCNNVGSPNLLFVFGATNDSSAGASVGSYKYSNWTEDDLCTYRPALAFLFDSLKKDKKLVGTKIVFVLNDGLRSDITSSTREICAHYKIPLLALSSISKTSSHPNIVGMRQICDQIKAFIETTDNIAKNK